ncbi:YciI family protein [Chelativorans sp. AA-79]|uniref:YciI family protein n=1 Tax=Chelativorans sp. AA-79 TaxID=3028735 RepID=UPI0023F88253|nr:YciI family protein [Chelativorans sp. AA-79]WEX11237.1 YciI family protein [Chelativorans sp. AA-79]
MRFLFLIHADEVEMKARPMEDALQCVREGMEYDEFLKQHGHFVASHGLEWASQATVLRSQGGKVVSTDGPFAETKEQLLGFFLVQAKDREEALSLASRLPMLASGSTVEVRAIDDLAEELL